MKESVVFLGTSHGDPSLTRFCSSTLYRFGTLNLLVDCGEPATALLIRQGVRPSELDAVFLTHMHADHTNGLASLCGQILKYPDRRVEVFFPEPSAIEPFVNWCRIIVRDDLPDEKLLHLEGIRSFWSKDGITVRPIPTEHMTPSFALSIETPQTRILHTGDLCCDFHDFPLTGDEEPYDLCVCEGTHFRQHPDRFVETMMKAPVRRLILNHIGPRWTDGQEYLLREIAAPLPYPVLIADDGTPVVIHE